MSVSEPTEPDRGLVELGMIVPAAPAAARRFALRRLIADRGFVTVSDVAREIGISDMTIRRDLDVLERDGLVRRSHGGAVPVASPAAEPSFATRRQVSATAKAGIAEAAAAMLHPGEVIGLDVGSTVAALARRLSAVSGLSIVTSSLQAVTAMPDPVLPDVYVLGGQLRPREGSLCGQITRAQLAQYWLTTVFLGVAGITAEGLHDYALAETEVKAAMMERASRVIVLADATKFGQRSFVRFCDFRRIAALVTDRLPPPGIAAALRATGTQVIVAGQDVPSRDG